MREHCTYERHEVKKCQSNARDYRPKPLVRENSKKILGEIVNDSHRSLGPVNRDQILPEDVPLSEPRFFNYFSEFHVVQNLHTQAFVGPYRFVHAPANHIECANSHVIIGLGISDLPWTMPKHK